MKRFTFLLFAAIFLSAVNTGVKSQVETARPVVDLFGSVDSLVVKVSKLDSLTRRLEVLK